MSALAAAEMAAVGAQVRVMAGRNDTSDIAIGDFDPQDASPGILMLCHLDTVHEVGSLAGPMAWREAGRRC